jgi:hypothetical protein
MPQGPAHLHEKFGDDSTAWQVLEKNFRQRSGIIYPKSSLYEEFTQDENDAIDYLILEWDWDFTQQYP